MSNFKASVTCGGKCSISYETTNANEFELLRHICRYFDDKEKVIPIEWIEEWGWKNGMSESMSLRVMIDDWEKENADTD